MGRDRLLSTYIYPPSTRPRKMVSAHSYAHLNWREEDLGYLHSQCTHTTLTRPTHPDQYTHTLLTHSTHLGPFNTQCIHSPHMCQSSRHHTELRPREDDSIDFKAVFENDSSSSRLSVVVIQNDVDPSNHDWFCNGTHLRMGVTQSSSPFVFQSCQNFGNFLFFSPQNSNSFPPIGRQMIQIISLAFVSGTKGFTLSLQCYV